MIKFVSYDGQYPNLCSGTLVLNICGEDVTFPRYCMTSGGGVYFTDNWSEEQVTTGPWIIDIPEEYEQFTDEIHTVVNDNVPYGCCGGCI